METPFFPAIQMHARRELECNPSQRCEPIGRAPPSSICQRCRQLQTE